MPLARMHRLPRGLHLHAEIHGTGGGACQAGGTHCAAVNCYASERASFGWRIERLGGVSGFL